MSHAGPGCPRVPESWLLLGDLAVEGRRRRDPPRSGGAFGPSLLSDRWAGVPVSLPTPGADAKHGPGKVLKGPKDATAALLLGLAEGQSQCWLPSPTLTDRYRAVPRSSAIWWSPAVCLGRGFWRGWWGPVHSTVTLLWVSAISVPWISEMLGDRQLPRLVIFTSYRAS